MTKTIQLSIAFSILFLSHFVWAQGPSPTSVLTAPADVTISCAADLHDPAVTGSAVYLNVGDVTYTDSDMSWDGCSGGTVLRTFTAEDEEGKTFSAQQSIYIRKMGNRQVTMPPHVCTNSPRYLGDLSPDRLPEGQGLPTVQGDGCGLDMYHEDRTKLLDGGARVRIERRWTVCDPCNGAPCREHLQVIGSELLGGENLKLNPETTTLPPDGGFELLQNRPNPFSAGTAIGFVLSRESDIVLTVQQADGRVVKEWEGTYPKGYSEVTFDAGSALTQGVLFYTLTVDGHRRTKRMVHTE